MSTNLLIVVLIIAAAFIIIPAVSAQRREPRCPNSPEGGWPEPTGCNFGVVHDVCGRPSCAMGPGEFCKYKRFPSSNCGEGTYCHCSRCMGCSLLSYTCYETNCVYAMPGTRR